MASPRDEVNTPLRSRTGRRIRRPTRCEGGQRQRIHGDTAARRYPALPTRRGTVQEISSVPASYFRVSKLLLPRRGHPLVRLHAGPESHRAQSCARVRYPAIRSVTATALLSGGPPKTSIENDIHQLVGPPCHRSRLCLFVDVTSPLFPLSTDGTNTPRGIFGNQRGCGVLRSSSANAPSVRRALLRSNQVQLSPFRWRDGGAEARFIGRLSDRHLPNRPLSSRDKSGRALL